MYLAQMIVAAHKVSMFGVDGCRKAARKVIQRAIRLNQPVCTTSELLAMAMAMVEALQKPFL